MERLISFFGLFVMMFLAWLLSSHKKILNYRVIFGGLALQFIFAFLVLKTGAGRALFQSAGDLVTTLLNYVDAGAGFVFGEETFREHYFAFKVLPTIIFFSSLMSVMYYLGVMQVVVKVMAIVMQKTLGTSGAESLSTAANIFVGQTEAPLVIKPYVAKMTQSELMAIMVGGFATIAGGVMAAFIGMGINATDLMTASVLAAPATLVIAKIMQPEVEEPVTRGQVKFKVEVTTDNIVHAAAEGAADGTKLAINVAGMLIAFMALIAMCNGFLGWLGDQYYWYAQGIAAVDSPDWKLETMLGYLFYPLAWVMGIPWEDCFKSGELLGLRLIASEFNSYALLSTWLQPGSGVVLADRSVALITYALCGFATLASIGIQIGGIGPLAPERTGDIARLGFRAMLGGNLASFMTACVAGIFLTDADFADRREQFQKSMQYKKQEDQAKIQAEEKKTLEQLRKMNRELQNELRELSPQSATHANEKSLPPADTSAPAAKSNDAPPTKQPTADVPSDKKGDPPK